MEIALFCAASVFAQVVMCLGVNIFMLKTMVMGVSVNRLVSNRLREERFRVPKRAVLGVGTSRFAMRNGSFWNVKRSIRGRGVCRVVVSCIFASMGNGLASHSWLGWMAKNQGHKCSLS